MSPKACILSNSPCVVTSAKLAEPELDCMTHFHGSTAIMAHFLSVEAQPQFSCFFGGWGECGWPECGGKGDPMKK